jgi:type IV secretory pathway VirB10-like protein
VSTPAAMQVSRMGSTIIGVLKATLLSTLLGVGSELGAGSDAGNNGDIIRALRRGSGDSLNLTGQKIVHRNLNIQPTLAIRPGFPVRVIVNRDLVLETYKATEGAFLSHRMRHGTSAR